MKIETVVGLIVLIFLLNYYFPFNTIKTEYFYGKKRQTKRQVVLKLYQMLYDVTKLLKKHNVENWICGGTLLGAVRNKGLIPWDDDLDIEIIEEDIYKIKTDKFKKELKKKGYHMVKYRFGFKIFLRNGGKKINKYRWTYPYMDIFVSRIEGNSTKLVIDGGTPDYWKKCVFKKKDLYPLKKYKFGEYKVLGPNNPKGYLDGCYGKDWNEVKYQEWDHQKEEEKFKQKVPLNKRDRQPAQPTGPIKK